MVFSYNLEQSNVIIVARNSTFDQSYVQKVALDRIIIVTISTDIIFLNRLVKLVDQHLC